MKSTVELTYKVNGQLYTNNYVDVITNQMTFLLDDFSDEEWDECLDCSELLELESQYHDLNCELVSNLDLSAAEKDEIGGKMADLSDEIVDLAYEIKESWSEKNDYHISNYL